MRSALVVLAALVSSCAGAGRAVDAAGERGTQLAAGGALGLLAWLIHPIGWIGGALAGLGGAVGSMLFAPRGAPVGTAPSSGVPYGRLAALVALVALAVSPRLRAAAWKLIKAGAARVRRRQ